MSLSFQFIATNWQLVSWYTAIRWAHQIFGLIQKYVRTIANLRPVTYIGLNFQTACWRHHFIDYIVVLLIVILQLNSLTYKSVNDLDRGATRTKFLFVKQSK